MIHRMEWILKVLLYSLMCFPIKNVWQTVSLLWCNPQAFLLWEANDNISNSPKQHGAYVSPTVELSSLTLRGHRKWHPNSARQTVRFLRAESTVNRPIYEAQWSNIKTAIGLWKIICYLQLLIVGLMSFVLIPEMCRSRTLY